MCSASAGDPPFNITWLLAGSGRSGIVSGSSNDDSVAVGVNIDAIFDNRSISIAEYSPFSSILTIDQLKSIHNGNYTCQITNHGGSARYSAVLSVAGAFKISNFTQNCCTMQI